MYSFEYSKYSWIGFKLKALKQLFLSFLSASYYN